MEQTGFPLSLASKSEASYMDRNQEHAILRGSVQLLYGYRRTHGIGNY
jgi:hypothetical protein